MTREQQETLGRLKILTKNFLSQANLLDISPELMYRRLLMEVIFYGTVTKTQQGTDALTRIGPMPMRFDLRKVFPMITERDISSFWLQAVGEIFCFINGGRTLEDLKKFGCHWWGPWATEIKCSKRGLETGDLGPGSYGAAFHDFPMVDGGGFNQLKNIVEQIIEFPHLRTHFVSPWIPQYTIRGTGKQQKVCVAPCHGWINIRVLNGKLTLHMHQRSGDTPVGVPANMVQYAALALAIAHVTGFEAHEYIHSFSDAHIYVDQLPAVEKILMRETPALPTVSMDKTVTDLFDFRREHFVLNGDYHPGPGIKDIPVAI